MNCFLYKRGGGSGGSNRPVVVKTALGSIISLTDSTNGKLKGLRIFGKTVQNGTPSPASPVPLESVGDDGSLTVNIGKSQTDANPQSATFATPNGLPGIPVASGGNYTDENGQIWVCDEIDGGRGVYVQRVAKSTITEKNFDSIQTNYSSDKSLLVGFGKAFGKENGLSNRACLSDRFATYHGNNPQSLSGFPGDVEHIGFNTSAGYAEYFYMRIFRNRLATQDAAGVKAWLADNNVNVLYQLIAPIETPLSAEELAQYAALHTNYPNTTIFNDEGADMEVKYTSGG